MKIKMVRQSGLPIDPEAMEAYKQEWKEVFDRAHDRCGKDMLRCQKLLARIERIMVHKHGLIAEVDIGTTKKSLYEILKEYGPISFAAATDGKTVVGEIMDQNEVMY